MNEPAFSRFLVDWFAVNQRDLPWRHTYQPYHVWLSEIMAQQTQLGRVVGYFERFVARYPDLHALAHAQEDEALKLWEGLGYYNRCRNLLKAARLLVAEHGGLFPVTHAGVLSLPGVGPYTAGAVMAIAYNEPHTAIDANVERVFSRVYNLDRPVKIAANQAFIEDRALALIPEGRAREFNQALMELGALVCTPKSPSCDICPVEPHCLARSKGLEEVRPVPGKRTEVQHISVATGVLVHENRFYIQKRRLDDVWPGLWEFPGGGIEPGETPEQAVVREYLEETGVDVQPLLPLATVSYSYTRFRVTLHGFYLDFSQGFQQPALYEALEGRFVALANLDGLAFPAGHRKLISIMRTDARLLEILKN
ncbi:MAG: A/G-specific adenine glycosylase [Proteobacteria bacterium]|nr:A/G-specific adenine glycosylase [Pseudomonadota bacterium]